MIKLILVEDNEIVRKGLIGLLEAEEDMEIIGEVAGGLQALELLRGGVQPDIVLTDLNMPEMDGIELTRRISSSSELSFVKVIILTMHAKQIFVDKALEVGAKGYLLKNGEFEELYDAIRQVCQNRTYISAGITS
ncbi:MAG TPA: response regulator transcription factor [Pedobacter sp.]